MVAENESAFSWLHFSDIHVGVDDQSQLWPRFGHLLSTDLEIILERVGRIDLVIFSGDLVQKGRADEFRKFDVIMDAILERIGHFQHRPQIIAIPGNHDLIRPADTAPELIALKQFWNEPNLRTGFWDKTGKGYRTFISRAFNNFTAWQNRAIERGIHLGPSQTGILPGDASYEIILNNRRISVVALNSTWLQLSGGDYQGKLLVDTRQLLSVTNDRPDEWVRSNDVNLLVTHHPENWLHPNAPATWTNDINPAGRFDLHFSVICMSLRLRR